MNMLIHTYRNSVLTDIYKRYYLKLKFRHHHDDLFVLIANLIIFGEIVYN